MSDAEFKQKFPFIHIDNNNLIQLNQDKLQPWTQEGIDLIWEELIKSQEFQAKINGDPADWQKIISKMLGANYNTTIASFNSFGPILERFLLKIVKINPEDLKKCRIEAWMPDDPDNKNKNRHIARTVMGISPNEEINLQQHSIEDKDNYNSIILADDAPRNITGVKEIAGEKSGIQLNKNDDNNPRAIMQRLTEDHGLSFELPLTSEAFMQFLDKFKVDGATLPVQLSKLAFTSGVNDEVKAAYIKFMDPEKGFVSLKNNVDDGKVANLATAQQEFRALLETLKTDLEKIDSPNATEMIKVVVDRAIKKVDEVKDKQQEVTRTPLSLKK